MTIKLHASLGEKYPSSSSSPFAISPELEDFLKKELSFHHLREFKTLRKETDPELYFEALLHFACRLKRDHEDGAASALFELLQQNPASSELKQRVQEELDAMRGKGSVGMRLEYLGSHFTKNALSPKMIIPMMLGTGVYQVVKTGTELRLATLAGRTWISRGLGRKFAASAVGTFVEVPVFAMSGRGLHQLVGDPVDSVTHSLESAYVTLGVMKPFGYMGHRAFAGIHRVDVRGMPTRFASIARYTQPTLSQSAMFLSLVTAHKLEEEWDLRIKVDGATFYTDIFESMVGLGIGAKAGHQALGRGYAGFQRDLQLRLGQLDAKLKAEREISRPKWFFPDGLADSLFPNFALAPAGSPKGRPIFSSSHAMAAMKEPGGGGQELVLQKLKEMERKLRVHSEEVSHEALGQLKTLLPELSEVERTELAIRTTNSAWWMMYQVRKDVTNFVVELGSGLSPDQSLNVLKGIEDGLKKGSDEALIPLEIMARIIPQLETQDRLPWARKLVQKTDLSGHYTHDRFAKAIQFLVSHLTETDRLTLSLELAAQWKAGNYKARSNLDLLLPHLTSTQKLAVAGILEISLEINDPVVRRGNLDMLRALIPDLDPGDRLPLRERIENFLNDPDDLVRRNAVEALRWTLTSFEPAARLDPILKIVDRLLSHQDKEWHLYVQALEYTFKDLSPEQRQAVTDRLEGSLSDEGWHFRRTALQILEHLIPHLPQDTLRRLAPKIAARMRDKEYFVWPSAVTSLRQVVRFLPETERLSWALLIEERWLEDYQYLSHSGRAALEWIAALIPEGDRQTLVHRMEAHLTHENKRIGEGALEFLRAALRYQTPRHRFPILLHFEDSLKNEVPEIKKNGRRTLEEYLPTLDALSRIEFLQGMIRRQGLAGLNLHFLPLLLKWISPEAMKIYSQKDQDFALELVAQYHASRLPFHEILWQDYLKASDREGFLRETSAQVREARRGETPRQARGNEVFMAYLGLDSPEGLSFEAFQKDLGHSFLLPPFLSRGFQASVAERKSSFQLIDKGKVGEGLSPIKELRNPYHLEMLLKKMVEAKEAPFPSLKEEIQGLMTLFKGQPIQMDEVVKEMKRLLPRVWGLKKDPRAQEFLIHFVLLLTWHSPGLQTQKEKIEKIRDSYKIPSDHFLEGVKALEEFYQDSVNDAVAEAGIRAEDLPFLRKQRRLLRAELERTKGGSGEEVVVEFIPSKTLADRFFGYVGEDCTKNKGDSIYRDDFQIFRMIAKDRLVGMLYLQKRRVGWFGKALVIAIQPRSFWEVDQTSLLRAVEEQLPKIARLAGFDYVLLMNDRNQQSNRQDMLAAIAKEGYPTLSWKKPIEGAVFQGKEFLVIWQKGEKFRPAPPLEISPRSAEEIRKEPIEVEEEIFEENPPHLLAKARPLEGITEKDLILTDEIIPEVDAFPVEVIPTSALHSLLNASNASSKPPLRVLLEDRADPQALRSFQHLVQNMMADAVRNLPVRKRRRIMVTMNGEFLAEVRRAFEEAGVPMPFGLGGMGRGVGEEETKPSQELMTRPPAYLIPYETLLLKKDELLPPGALVLRRRPLEAILSDPKITRTDHGWFEPTLKGKNKVVESGEIVGGEGVSETALVRGGEITLQELFDFYTVVFYQGYQFRGYLRLLQNRGADIQPLAEVVETLSQQLNKGLDHLFARRFQQALEILQMADLEGTQFQKTMRRIAHTVGLEIDPVTGMMYPLPSGFRGPGAFGWLLPLAFFLDPALAEAAVETSQSLGSQSGDFGAQILLGAGLGLLGMVWKRGKRQGAGEKDISELSLSELGQRAQRETEAVFELQRRAGYGDEKAKRLMGLVDPTPYNSEDSDGFRALLALTSSGNRRAEEIFIERAKTDSQAARELGLLILTNWNNQNLRRGLKEAAATNEQAKFLHQALERLGMEPTFNDIIEAVKIHRFLLAYFRGMFMMKENLQPEDYELLAELAIQYEDMGEVLSFRIQRGDELALESLVNASKINHSLLPHLYPFFFDGKPKAFEGLLHHGWENPGFGPQWLKMVQQAFEDREIVLQGATIPINLRRLRKLDLKPLAELIPFQSWAVEMLGEFYDLEHPRAKFLLASAKNIQRWIREAPEDPDAMDALLTLESAGNPEAERAVEALDGQPIED